VATAVLPALRQGVPIYYRGALAAIVHGRGVVIGEALPPADQRVVQAMALAARNEPYLTSEQQLMFAAYQLLPEETFGGDAPLADEVIAARRGVPLDLVRLRRSLPALINSRRASVRPGGVGSGLRPGGRGCRGRMACRGSGRRELP
jgi:hypothetical protein